MQKHEQSRWKYLTKEYKSKNLSFSFVGIQKVLVFDIEH